MGGRVVTWMAANAEDLFLALGAVLISLGIGIQFGYACGLIAAGALCVTYGAWITQGRH